jgi:hypothetical protein
VEIDFLTVLGVAIAIGGFALGIWIIRVAQRWT